MVDGVEGIHYLKALNGTLFVVKPEGVSNVFLMYFLLNQYWGNACKIEGVEGYQRG